LCVAQFVDVLDVNAVIVALPSIGRDLGFSGEDLQGVISAYMLFFAGFLLLAGRMADLFGRRRMFMVGLALFAAASLVCGLAGTPLVLVAARAVQGLGAAITSPAALSIITATFAAGGERNLALGVWTAVAAAGGAAGLVVGGLITGGLGWGWIFFVNIPIGAAAFALAPVVLQESRDATASRRLDALGAVTVTAGLVLVVYGLTRLEAVGVRSVVTVGTLLLAAGLLAAFVFVERSVADPLVPLRIFRSRDLVGAGLVATALTAATGPTAVLATIYLQGVLGYSPALAGLAGLPFSLAVIAGSFAGSRLTGRAGARATMATGLVGVAVAGLVATGISAGGGVAYVLSGATVSGLSLGCASVASTARGTSAADEGEKGLASGLLNSCAQVGSAVGLAILFTVAAVRTDALSDGAVPTPADLVGGYRLAFLAGAALAVAGVAVARFVVREKLISAEADRPDRRASKLT
jgi:EmrB/QacA subfamily drug resistance transporter